MATPSPSPSPSQPPPGPGPGELEAAFRPFSPLGLAVLYILDATPRYDPGAMNLRAALARHQAAEFDLRDPVPYHWQVGRFVRHALDANNVAALHILAHIILGAGHDCASQRTRCRLWADARDIRLCGWPSRWDAPGPACTISMCLEFSLHPDKSMAMRLFRDVVGAMPAGELQAWRAFVPDTMFQLVESAWAMPFRVHGYPSMMPAPADWKRWVQLRELEAKLTACLATGSPFALHFGCPFMHDMRDLPFAILRIYAYAFMQHDRETQLTASTAQHLLLVAMQVSSSSSSAASSTLVRHLCHFVDLRWPNAHDPVPTVYADTVRLLAGRLANKALADAHILPHIMSFVCHAPPPPPSQQPQHHARQLELARAALGQAQVAATAFGSAQLARARMAAAARQAGTAAAASVRRARDEEEEEGGQTAAKRRV